MRREDFAATAIVKAVKGIPLENTYGDIPIAGRIVRIEDDNRDDALDWFAKWARAHVDRFGNQNKILVPIPGSQVTESHDPDFRTSEIAESIRQRCGTKVEVSTCLRFKKPMLSSRSGGTRNHREIYTNMVIIEEIPNGDIVLVDDVYTSGGHARAAAQMFLDEGRTVLGVVCCGKTCQEQLDNPFEIEEEEYLEI